jgi:hypothetical protein
LQHQRKQQDAGKQSTVTGVKGHGGRSLSRCNIFPPISTVGCQANERKYEYCAKTRFRPFLRGEFSKNRGLILEQRSRVSIRRSARDTVIRQWDHAAGMGLIFRLANEVGVLHSSKREVPMTV